MTPQQLVAWILGFVLAALVLALGYWWYRKNKPIHSFIGVDFGAQSVQPRRIKNLFGPFRFKRNDKTIVRFPVPQGYAIPRQDGKGTLFFGDLSTGQLFKPIRDEANRIKLQFAHGIFNEYALADGRVENVVRATKGEQGITLMHLLMGIGVIVILLIFNIYQFSRAGA